MEGSGKRGCIPSEAVKNIEQKTTRREVERKKTGRASGWEGRDCENQLAENCLEKKKEQVTQKLHKTRRPNTIKKRGRQLKLGKTVFVSPDDFRSREEFGLALRKTRAVGGGGKVKKRQGGRKTRGGKKKPKVRHPYSGRSGEKTVRVGCVDTAEEIGEQPQNS